MTEPLPRIAELQQRCYSVCSIFSTYATLCKSTCRKESKLRKIKLAKNTKYEHLHTCFLKCLRVFGPWTSVHSRCCCCCCGGGGGHRTFCEISGLQGTKSNSVEPRSPKRRSDHHPVGRLFPRGVWRYFVSGQNKPSNYRKGEFEN